MVAKGILMDDVPENGVGRWSNNYTSEEPINYSEDSPTHSPRSRAGNKPSYSGSARARLGLSSGSARKKLGSGSARELNKSSLSLNLDLINLRLGSGSARKKLGSGR